MADPFSAITLDTAGSIVRLLFAAAPLSCLVGASIGVAALVALAGLPTGEAAYSWWNWWAGDAIGILIAAPLTFVFIGTPRPEWAPRRLAIALPLGTALVLLVGLEIQVAKWEQQRLQSRFERDASHLASLVRTRFPITWMCSRRANGSWWRHRPSIRPLSSGSRPRGCHAIRASRPSAGLPSPPITRFPPSRKTT